MLWDRADVSVTEIKCTVIVMHLNHPETLTHRPLTWFMEKVSQQNGSLVPKRLGTADLEHNCSILKYPGSTLRTTAPQASPLQSQYWVENGENQESHVDPLFVKLQGSLSQVLVLCVLLCFSSALSPMSSFSQFYSSYGIGNFLFLFNEHSKDEQTSLLFRDFTAKGN